jgi:hypothetical protein
MTAGLKRVVASFAQVAGSICRLAASWSVRSSSSSGVASSPVRPWSTSSGRQPRRNPTTGQPSASASVTAVPPGFVPGDGEQCGAGGRKQVVESAAGDGADPPHLGTVHVRGDGVAPVAHVGIGEERRVGEGSVEAVLVVVRADGAGQDQRPAESSRGAYRDVLAFARRDPAEDHDVAVLGGQRSSVCALRERRGEVDVAQAAGT